MADSRGVVTSTTNITGNNAYHVVYADGTSTPISTTTKLDGFTITAGQASGSSPSITGGGFFCDGQGSGGECSPRLTNVSFHANSATNGGAMYNAGNSGGTSSPRLTNVSFHANSASARGGAMYNAGFSGGTSSPSLTNVILWGNVATAEGHQLYNSNVTPVISYTLIQSNTNDIENAANSSITWGDNILTNDPLFVDGPNGDLRLQAGSPARDMGNNSALPADAFDLDNDGNTAEPVSLDLAGKVRVQNGTVDMGTYEFVVPPKVFFMPNSIEVGEGGQQRHADGPSIARNFGARYCHLQYRI